MILESWETGSLIHSKVKAHQRNTSSPQTFRNWYKITEGVRLPNPRLADDPTAPQTHSGVPRSVPPNASLPTAYARPGSASEPRNEIFSPKLTLLAAQPYRKPKEASLAQRTSKNIGGKTRCVRSDGGSVLPTACAARARPRHRLLFGNKLPTRPQADVAPAFASTFCSNPPPPPRPTARYLRSEDRGKRIPYLLINHRRRRLSWDFLDGFAFSEDGRARRRGDGEAQTRSEAAGPGASSSSRGRRRLLRRDGGSVNASLGFV